MNQKSVASANVDALKTAAHVLVVDDDPDMLRLLTLRLNAIRIPSQPRQCTVAA